MIPLTPSPLLDTLLFILLYALTFYLAIISPLLWFLFFFDILKLRLKTIFYLTLPPMAIFVSWWIIYQIYLLLSGVSP